METPSETLYLKIRSSVQSISASTVRTHRRSIAAIAAATVLAAMVVMVASHVVYGRQAVGLHVGVQSTVTLFVVACLLFALLLASTTVAMWRGRSGLGADAVSLWFSAALIAPIYAALVWLYPVHAPGSTVLSVEISPLGVRCFAIAAVVGLAVLACFALALRGAAPAASRLRGAVLGAAAGAWAGFALFVFCPSGDQQHLLVGHVLPVVGFTLLGSVVLGRTLRP